MDSPNWKRLILEAMSRVLKPKGFRKKATLFSRPRDGIVHLVGLQSSTGSTASSLKVTVNVAIWLEALAPVRGGNPDAPSPWDAPWRERIGFLMPDHRDVWWTACTDDEAVEVAEAISTAIRDAVLPNLDKYGDSSKIIQDWQDGICTGITDYQRQEFLRKLASG